MNNLFFRVPSASPHKISDSAFTAYAKFEKEVGYNTDSDLIEANGIESFDLTIKIFVAKTPFIHRCRLFLLKGFCIIYFARSLLPGPNFQKFFSNF